jgi:formyltetrahydrofolate-dependent phosphoribosylglycinamide formyltransferase
MMALVEAAQEKDYPAEIIGVLSNKPKALGLERAKAKGIPTVSIDHKNYKTRLAFEKALDKALVSMDTELVCCAGFMRVLTPWFVKRWKGRLVNIHPSLLPKYKGLDTHQRAINAGDTEAGCSVHWVTEELDGGAVILQKAVKIHKDDTADSLAARILPTELTLYTEALEKIAKDLRNA